jgi:hypothetical protein
MTPARFRECLRQIRWTSIDIVSALQCDLAWIEALETGEIDVPGDVADWLEKLAACHCENQPPLACRPGVRNLRTLSPKHTIHRL